jgi:hypothetical protein
MPVSFKYTGDDEREIPACRVIVKPGDVFDVDDPEVAKGFDGQDMFEKVTQKVAAKLPDTAKAEEKP